MPVHFLLKGQYSLRKKLGDCCKLLSWKVLDVSGSTVQKFREHAHGDDNNPLLIFSEGTCVNNEYIVMFKKSAFEIDASVCPVAIKYNKIFVDAFWNSRK
ncbi:hypothetical protein BVRB_3g056070 isoform B [Beta vulgaris subsp. vulgaris]|uniref:Phospholipid/glycerol acyltransferase domain-containing protein n=1 Tax=Beta vulgaris subsp. vulgaris TaxID=3555 RepID=A0A0J8FJ57_BETVV|nr:hypothetical protein BVRB_3g056070 isoform B [Beta vulgaris subsp. vulgaris]